MAVDASNISSADASAIIDGALFDAQSGGKAISGASDNPTLLPSGSGDVKEPGVSPEETDEEKQVRQAKEDLLGKEEADALAKEEAEQAAREKTLMGVAEKYLKSGKKTAQGANIKIGNFPTPGNVGFPLALLAIFFFILVTYNGNTRFQWAWKVLTNNAHINENNQTDVGTGGLGGIGTGTFGDGSSSSSDNSQTSPAAQVSFSSNGMGGNPYS